MSQASASRQLFRWFAARPSALQQQLQQRSSHFAAGGDDIKWVFLGPPGVGKGTYSSRVAEALGVAHIAAGDLVRAEIKSGSGLGNQVRLRPTGPASPRLPPAARAAPRPGARRAAARRRPTRRPGAGAGRPRRLVRPALAAGALLRANLPLLLRRAARR
jgi:hypothetical protein